MYLWLILACPPRDDHRSSARRSFEGARHVPKVVTKEGFAATPPPAIQDLLERSASVVRERVSEGPDLVGIDVRVFPPPSCRLVGQGDGVADPKGDMSLCSGDFW